MTHPGRRRVARGAALGVCVLAGAWGVFTPGLAARTDTLDVAARPLCRCAEQPLPDYFAAATDVFIGTLVRVETRAASRRLVFRLVDAPFRWSAREPRFAGDEVTVRTALSTAECGVQGEPGATYVVFGDTVAARGADAADGAPLPQVSSCTGTRVFRRAQSDSLHGFMDVPGTFVAAQLTALSGLHVLRSISGTTPDDLDSLGGALDARATPPRDGVLIGLLELPASGTGDARVVRVAPRSDAEILATTAGAVGLNTREVSYEQPAAVVQARQGEWYRVLLADGRSGWLAAPAVGPAAATWHPYETLVPNRLGYLTGAWSGHVWPAPGAGLPVRLPLDRPDANGVRRDQYPAEVLETTRVGGTLWLRVSVLATDPCESGPKRPSASGWIPAYGHGGRPSAWFHSRGC